MRRRIPTSVIVETDLPVTEKLALDSETEGKSITVTLGREVFTPLAYSSFEVGPISLTADVREGETANQAYIRIRASLSIAFRTEFEVKFQDYLERAKVVRERVKERA